MLKTFILPIILTSFLVLCVKRAEGEHIKNYPRYNPMVPIGQYHKTWRIKPKNNLIPDKKNSSKHLKLWQHSKTISTFLPLIYHQLT